MQISQERFQSLKPTQEADTDQKVEQIVAIFYQITSAVLVAVLWGRDNPDVSALIAKIHDDDTHAARLKSDTLPAQRECIYRDVGLGP